MGAGRAQELITSARDVLRATATDAAERVGRAAPLSLYVAGAANTAPLAICPFGQFGMPLLQTGGDAPISEGSLITVAVQSIRIDRTTSLDEIVRVRDRHGGR